MYGVCVKDICLGYWQKQRFWAKVTGVSTVALPEIPLKR